jgi:hypothetical protein
MQNLQILSRMKKTGSLFFFLILLFLSGPFFAQKNFIDLSISKNKVEVGEVFTLTITSNIRSNQGNIGVNLPPTFKKVGMTSQGSSDIEINGRVFIESTVSQGYVCTKAGRYNVGPAIIAGKKSQTIILEVVAENKPQLNSSAPVQSNKEPVFGIISSPKTKVFVGEPFVIDSKIYSRYNVVGIDQNYTLSKANGGLETINLQDPTKYNSGQLAINGVQHVFIDFAKQLCFSNTNGKATLSSFSADLQIESGFFPETVSLNSNAFQIVVKPLPAGKPESFIGLVGNFNFEIKNGKTSLTQGEIFPITLEVTGIGNLHLISEPRLLLPDGFEIYGEVKRNEEVQYTNEGSGGNILFVYNIRANKSGRFIFPKQEFSFFDLASESYKTINSNPFEVNSASNPNYKANNSKLTIDFNGTSKTSIFLKLALGIVALIFTVFMYLRWKKSNTKPIQKVVQKDKKESFANDQIKELITQEVSFPSDLAFMSTGNMSSYLYTAIIQKMQIITGQNYGNYPELIETLKQTHPLQVDKIDEIISIINHNRYGGDGMMEQRQKEILIQKTKEVLTELI